MDLFFVLLVLLVVTRVFGELAVRANQPSLVGELIGGIILGIILGLGSELNNIYWLPDLSQFKGNEVFKAITDLGMFFLMLYAGLEMKLKHLYQYSWHAFGVALGGMMLPLICGIGLGFIFLPDSELFFLQSFFLGIALAITAVPVTIRILIDLEMLESRFGLIIVSAAVIDDVLGLLLLAWLTGLLGDDGAGFGVYGIASITLNILGFFVITYIIGAYIFPAGGKLLPYVKQRELGVSAILIAAFAFSVFAEILGLHFILGAFIAGMFFGRGAVGQEVYEDVRNKISGITFGFLAPIFFASVGMNLNVNVFFEIPVFLVVLVVVAFLAKFFGAGMVAWMAGLSRRESCAVGVGMSARGAVELVIAGIALEAGLFIQPPGVESAILEHLYSAVVFMAIFTTLLAPILLKRIYKSQM